MSKNVDIITGANGFIGSILKEQFDNKSVLLLSGNNKKDDGFNYVKYEMNQDIELIVDQDIKVNNVFHLAHDFSNKKVDEENINVYGLKKIIHFCRQRNARLIYISSFMAIPAESEYGKVKLECESLVREYNESIIIRPPVVTDSKGGIFNTINRIFKYSPIFFIPGSGNYNMYSINVQNLTKFIVKSTQIKTTEIIYAYDKGPIKFTEMLDTRNKIKIKVPIYIIRLLLLLPKFFGFNLKSLSNNGLNTLLTMPILNFKHKNYKDF